MSGLRTPDLGHHHHHILDCHFSFFRDFTKEPHTPGSIESYNLALKIKDNWLEYGFTKVELKKYNVLLSFPEKPGLVTVNYPNGTQFYRNTPVDENMDPAYKDPRVLPPFNAYSPNGTVKVHAVSAYIII